MAIFFYLLQILTAYLVTFFFLPQESERKAYNPRGFCKVYTMDHQLLNTGEQKDMAEFFTNLISKLEEMTPELVSYVNVCIQDNNYNVHWWVKSDFSFKFIDKGCTKSLFYVITLS